MAFYSSTELRILPNYDISVRSVNHRGYNTVAPENTLPAFQLSKHMGFDYVETDIEFTSDNVPVLLHDLTINRTSNGTGAINSLTFNQVRQYDFGSWKNSIYAGTKIPSLEEFLILCKKLMLHPYMEIKSNVVYTNEQLQIIVDMVNRCGMRNKVSYISFNVNYLTAIRNIDNDARLGLLRGSYLTNDLETCINLKTGNNTVFYDVDINGLTNELIETFSTNNIDVEVWTVDDANTILNLDRYITGVTSDNLNAGKVIYDNFVS